LTVSAALARGLGRERTIFSVGSPTAVGRDNPEMIGVVCREAGDVFTGFQVARASARAYFPRFCPVQCCDPVFKVVAGF
jgi:hypothetical protein